MTYNAEKLAKFYFSKIVRLHRVPLSIISNRGTQFTSMFWRTLHAELGTRLDVSTAFHPQNDGQSERTIQLLEDMLRACVIEFGGHWDNFLPLAEFSYNNSYHSSIDPHLRHCMGEDVGRPLGGLRHLRLDLGVLTF